MRNFSINGRRSGKKIKSFLAILLTFIMIIGAFPITAMAASYTVNRVSNLNALSKTIVLNQGAYEPLFISRLRNPQIKITNSDFKTGPRGAADPASLLRGDQRPAPPATARPTCAAGSPARRRFPGAGDPPWRSPAGG